MAFYNPKDEGTNHKLRWLKDGFRHCAVVRRDYAVWTVIEDTQRYLSVEPSLVEDYPTVGDLIPGCTYLNAEVKVEERYRAHFCWFSCVEVVKAFLGIRKPLLLTPYQLYRYLRNE